MLRDGRVFQRQHIGPLLIQLEKITSMHIEKVMDGIRENTTRVWNTKAYLMAALFNSVSTIEHHYTMQYNADSDDYGSL